MADLELKSDDEKAEELKAWWRANGTSVVAGVALTIGGLFGWNQWKEHKLSQSEGASKLFSQLNAPGTDSDVVLKQINDDYSSTVYASLAALTAAKESCESGKTVQCIEQLKLASNSSQVSVASVAKLRLARVLILNEKFDDAQRILAKKMPTAYQSMITELNGDIHFAKKEFSKAREAYDRAILSSDGKNIQILKMKRDDLGDHLKSGA